MTTSVRECVRCSAITTKGTRCTRRTCIYPGECYQHFQQHNGLKLAPSSIPNSGLGLVTIRSFQANRKIADYTGDIVPDTDWASDPSDYAAAYDATHTIDGRSTQSGIARYSNDCRTADRLAGRCRGNNARLRITRQKNVILESKGRIAANTEVFNSYGNYYWN